MIGNHHQITDYEFFLHSASSVGWEKCFNPDCFHNAYRKRDLFHGITFIIMKATLHGHNVLATHFPKNKLAAVPFHGGNGEVGYFFVRDDQFNICLLYTSPSPRDG